MVLVAALVEVELVERATQVDFHLQKVIMVLAVLKVPLDTQVVAVVAQEPLVGLEQTVPLEMVE